MNTINPNKAAKSERHDLIGTVVVCSFIAVLVGLRLLTPFLDGYFNTKLSAALPQGLLASELSGAALWTLSIAHVSQLLTLLALIVAIGFSAILMLRGDIFTKRNERLAMATSWLVLIWDLTSGGTTDVAFWLLTIVLIGSFAITIKRGIKLEEEVDGLV